MSKKFLAKVTDGFKSVRSDERAAESSEVILVLVLLVIGLLGAWAFLRNKIGTQASRTGNCIGAANTANSC